MGQESSDKVRWKERLRSKRLSQRLTIAAILFIALFVVVHFRESSSGILSPNMRAPKDVFADIQFTFPDEEETRILRQESIRDIETIYKVDPQVADRRSQEFESSLVQDRTWRELLPDVTFEELSGGSDWLRGELLAARFGSKRTLQRLDHLDLLPLHFFPIAGNGSGEALPEGFWATTQQHMLETKRYSKPAVIYILTAFQSMKWPLRRDLSTQKQLRKEVEKKFPEQYTTVKKGEKIVSKGTLVSRKQAVMLKSMQEALRNRNFFSPLKLLGSLMICLIIVVVSGYYLCVTQVTLTSSVRQLALYATIIVLTLLVAKVTDYFLVHNMSLGFYVIRYPLFIPFAVILLCVLLNFEVAFFTGCFLTVILGLSLTVSVPRFIAVNLLAGTVAILTSRSLRKRKEVFVVCSKVWLCCIPLFFVYQLMGNLFWDVKVLFDLATTLVFLLLTSILVVGLLPIFESIFHMMTDITLMEYMDPNNELLRKLSIEAPGTYQHCLVVGSIAEAAAQAIGANGLLCRVSTLYHDIGKLSNPHYFTENQMGGFNIHQLLTPLESTQVIIAHVVDGEALARKHGLPESFIDIIREHHGTTLVYYFYCKQIEQAGGDASDVDEKQFRYLGPKPQSKEAAIIMMADTVEAASRSLENVNEEALTELVNRLIGEKLSDGQFDECPLTFKEFGIIKKTIVRVLSVARHLRIKYPEKISS